MGSIETYSTAGGRRYCVRYRDSARRSREKSGFHTKRDAEAYLAIVTVNSARGDWIDPNASRTEVRTLGNEWLCTQTHLKPSSRRPVEIAWRKHVEPFWGGRRVGEIQHSEVQRWVAGFDAGASTVIRAYGVLAAILDVAVRDRRISNNPARGVRLPRKVPKKRAYLTGSQVEILASHSGRHATLIYTLAYTGVRWGEVTGLRIESVDTVRRRLLIRENAVNVGGRVIVGTPKSHQSRSVPYPRFLAVLIDEQCEGKSRDQLVFGSGLTHLLSPDGRRGWFVSAIRKSQREDAKFPEITLHDLRHTAASLAISAGANPKAVQRMLGHASAAMTLDVYADLFEDDLDAVSDRLDQARSLAVTRIGGANPTTAQTDLL